MKIFVPIIAYGGQCYVDYSMSILNFVLKSQQKGINLSFHPITFESLISRGRNASVAFALQQDYSHIFFFDSDVVFNADDAIKLIEADKDVCVGAYPKKYLNNEKMFYSFKTLPKKRINDWGKYSTDFSTEVTEDTVKSVLDGSECTVNYAATGFMCIKMDVFRKLIEVKPELKYKNDIDGYMGAGDNFYDFFKVGVNPETKKYESEDYGFCNLWRSVGGEIHVIPDINLTHIGKYHFQGNLKKQINNFYVKPTTI